MLQLFHESPNTFINFNTSERIDYTDFLQTFFVPKILNVNITSFQRSQLILQLYSLIYKKNIKCLFSEIRPLPYHLFEFFALSLITFLINFPPKCLLFLLSFLPIFTLTFFFEPTSLMVGLEKNNALTLDSCFLQSLTV